MLPRIHLFEWEDQRWFPNLFRAMVTDFLRFQYATLGLHQSICKRLLACISKHNITHIVDLCSGGGGPLLLVDNALKEHHSKTINITLSDLYPRSLPHLPDNMSYRSTSVDVTGVIATEANSLITMFTAFHHFQEPTAVQVLDAICATKRPFFIYEATSRRTSEVLAMLLISPLYLLATSPFVKPFSLTRMIFTYLLPVFPVVTTWDGFVSCLRSYNSNEWLKLVANSSSAAAYDVDIITEKIGATQSTFVIGRPRG